MAPRTTQAIGIFVNSAYVVSLILRKSDRLLFPIADVQTSRNMQFSGAANGQKRTLLMQKIVYLGGH